MTAAPGEDRPVEGLKDWLALAASARHCDGLCLVQQQ